MGLALGQVHFCVHSFSAVCTSSPNNGGSKTTNLPVQYKEEISLRYQVLALWLSFFEFLLFKLYIVKLYGF